MEYLEFTPTGKSFHIEGFPDAVKVLRIKEAGAKKLAHLLLHKGDLDFALECLDGINSVPQEPAVLHQAVWHSAIVHFTKCFGGNQSRSSLVAKKIYKTDRIALEMFEYFRALRNKHIVHDENAYAQCLPGAALNKKGLSHKIAKIVCMNANVVTLNEGNYSNLHKLITLARIWVTRSSDQLMDSLTSELEALEYEELFAREEIVYSKPKTEDIGKARKAP